MREPRRPQGTQPLSPGRTLGQIAAAKRHSVASVHRCTHTDPSVGVSVLMQIPRSGQSADVVHATVHNPICRPSRRLLKPTQRGVVSAQVADAVHAPYVVSLRELHMLNEAARMTTRGHMIDGATIQRAGSF